MDTAFPQKFPFILDRNLAKGNCTENRVCTSCNTVVLERYIYIVLYLTAVYPVTGGAEWSLLGKNSDIVRFCGHSLFGVESSFTFTTAMGLVASTTSM